MTCTILHRKITITVLSHKFFFKKLFSSFALNFVLIIRIQAHTIIFWSIRESLCSQNAKVCNFSNSQNFLDQADSELEVTKWGNSITKHM